MKKLDVGHLIMVATAVIMLYLVGLLAYATGFRDGTRTFMRGSHTVGHEF